MTTEKEDEINRTNKESSKNEELPNSAILDEKINLFNEQELGDDVRDVLESVFLEIANQDTPEGTKEIDDNLTDLMDSREDKIKESTIAIIEDKVENDNRDKSDYNSYNQNSMLIESEYKEKLDDLKEKEKIYETNLKGLNEKYETFDNEKQTLQKKIEDYELRIKNTTDSKEDYDLQNKKLQDARNQFIELSKQLEEKKELLDKQETKLENSMKIFEDREFKFQKKRIQFDEEKLNFEKNLSDETSDIDKISNLNETDKDKRDSEEKTSRTKPQEKGRVTILYNLLEGLTSRGGFSSSFLIDEKGMIISEYSNESQNSLAVGAMFSLVSTSVIRTIESLNLQELEYFELKSVTSTYLLKHIQIKNYERDLILLVRYTETDLPVDPKKSGLDKKIRRRLLKTVKEDFSDFERSKNGSWIFDNLVDKIKFLKESYLKSEEDLGLLRIDLLKNTAIKIKESLEL